jgi:hypothetical protein
MDSACAGDAAPRNDRVSEGEGDLRIPAPIGHRRMAVLGRRLLSASASRELAACLRDEDLGSKVAKRLTRLLLRARVSAGDGIG